MKIALLGSAGAFDFGETSASFLLEVDDKNILIDCGHNVLKKLSKKGYMNPENNIDYVFITHLHMDHVADLESLIYYNYFILKKKLKIYIPHDIKNDFFNLFPMSKYSHEYQNGRVKEIDCMYEICSTYEINTENNVLYLVPFEANHPGIKAYGYKIKKQVNKYYDGTRFNQSFRVVCIISGDSKANFELLEIAEKELNVDDYNSDNPLYIFHDFSNWNDVTRNVHCCSTDFNLVYSELISGENKERVKIFKYHNGDNVDLEIEI